MRGANLRRWLKRPECPKVLQEFHRLFNLYHDNEASQNGPEGRGTAYYDFAGMHFSKAETHMGNSLVSYLDDGRTSFGSIEKIKVTPQGSVRFAIRHQAPLPPGKNDPFLHFPHFPARTYSSKMVDTLVDVDPIKVLGHYARFNFSGGRAVILDLRRVCSFVTSFRRVSNLDRINRDGNAVYFNVVYNSTSDCAYLYFE
ncbi:hypothetical protein K438DRAFT_1630884 [Mycena galopus ATCC 62051]|nr:hypothetical protein K438DRAFT_1630884 [Mycena galopus ATCC 62051]